MFDKVSQVVRFLIFICLLSVLMAGCREQQRQESANAAAAAGEEFHIGIVPERNIFHQRERYEPLARYLSEKLGITIELSMLVTYENIVDNIQSRELDAVFLGSFAGAVALKKLGARPLARPQYSDGTSTYRGLLFARKDSGIATARDMEGKIFAFTDKGTTAGWLLPLHYFKENDIDDPFSWFGEMYFTGTHEDAIVDVLNGKADIGAAKDTVFYQLAQTDSRILAELKILAMSPPVPENALLFVRKNEPLQKAMKKVLLTMHQDEEGRQILQKFGAVQFIETTVKDYQPVFTYASDIGLDLANYENKKDLDQINK